ncbi:MAG: amino acid ABC transporter substrate-binding protein [Alteromonadales bacterium]|nr:amino acid ABC transporter substrate-binding protein [Alteromonadales bacterium]
MLRILLYLILLFISSDMVANRGTSDDMPVVYVVDLKYWGELPGGSNYLVGIYPDIFRELSRRMKQPFKLKIASYERMVYSVNAGDVDFIISLPNEYEKNKLRIGINIWTIKLGRLSLKTKPITSMLQAQKVRVGMIQHAPFSPEFDQSTKI